MEVNKLNDSDAKNFVFEVMKFASKEVSKPNFDNDKEILEVIPRLFFLFEEFETIGRSSVLQCYKSAYNSLARVLGLWNYLDEDAEWKDSVVKQMAYVDQFKIVLHIEQIKALNKLLEGKNVILSAPTSFGKSALIDILLLLKDYDRVAIIVPTIALLDEVRRRLLRNFRGKYQIISHHSEKIESEKYIFVGTQERILNRKDLKKFDFVVVDEFYKLDPDRGDERCSALNAAVYKLIKGNTQFFFIGPNIDEVVNNQGNWKFEFIKTKFSTVAVNTLDLANEPNKEIRLQDEVVKKQYWPALVYVSSPDRSRKIGKLISQNLPIAEKCTDFSNWILDNFGSNWEYVDYIKNGIALHYGGLPRSIQSKVIRDFDKNLISIIVCTSTIIEGVNTAAKSVFIYDKKISNANYDFFTFSNIRGRAGRLGKHAIGEIIIFNQQPEKNELSVKPQLFDEVANTEPEYSVFLDNVDSDKRILDFKQEFDVTQDEIEILSVIGFSMVKKLHDEVMKRSRENDFLNWKNYPEYYQLQSIIEIIKAVQPSIQAGFSTPKHITYMVNDLSEAESIKIFFHKYNNRTSNFSKYPFANIFKFLRACEFHFPNYIACIEILARRKFPDINYKLYIAKLSVLFRPEPVHILEEMGIPMQISERFYANGDDAKSLSLKLYKLAVSKDSKLSSFESEWIIEALPDNYLI
ncbi:MAG: DEAD/DEAH box helicase [Cyclobacteriaceae bacterium]|nr:DEAD/DEAH box helicase [Cyclobacteriaceae bacterium]